MLRAGPCQRHAQTGTLRVHSRRTRHSGLSQSEVTHLSAASVRSVQASTPSRYAAASARHLRVEPCGPPHRRITAPSPRSTARRSPPPTLGGRTLLAEHGAERRPPARPATTRPPGTPVQRRHVPGSARTRRPTASAGEVRTVAANAAIPAGRARRTSRSHRGSPSERGLLLRDCPAGTGRRRHPATVRARPPPSTQQLNRTRAPGLPFLFFWPSSQTSSAGWRTMAVPLAARGRARAAACTRAARPIAVPA